MSKKIIKIVIPFILGVIMVVCALLLNNEIQKSISGVLIGIGASLFGLGINNYVTNRIEKKNPEIVKNKKISMNDERNITIKNRAKAKASDITAWLFMAIAYLTILIDAPMWLTLVVVLVFVIHNSLIVYFTGKYEKEM